MVRKQAPWVIYSLSGALGKVLNLSESQVPSLYNGNESKTCL